MSRKCSLRCNHPARLEVSVTMKPYVAAVLIFLAMPACTTERDTTQPSGRPSSASPSGPPVAVAKDGLPPEVAAVRGGILAAAADHDYEALRELFDPNVFLSDFGFGIDPTNRWKRVGDEPIELMAALLEMDYLERDSNEGHLYEWPAYDAETKRLADISRADRNLFLSVMTREEFRRLVPNAEFGYVGPRLGILADGTWWFFVEGGGGP